MIALFFGASLEAAPAYKEWKFVNEASCTKFIGHLSNIESNGGQHSYEKEVDIWKRFLEDSLKDWHELGHTDYQGRVSKKKHISEDVTRYLDKMKEKLLKRQRELKISRTHLQIIQARTQGDLFRQASAHRAFSLAKENYKAFLKNELDYLVGLQTTFQTEGINAGRFPEPFERLQVAIDWMKKQLGE
jgi:hypothetical protein